MECSARDWFLLLFNVIGSYLWRRVYTSHIGGAHSSPRNAHNPFLMWANHLFQEIGLDMQFSGSGWGGQVFPLTDCEERNTYHLFLWLQPSIQPSIYPWLVMEGQLIECGYGEVKGQSFDLLNQCSFLSRNARIYMLIMMKCQTNGKLDHKDIFLFTWVTLDRTYWYPLDPIVVFVPHNKICR